MNYLRNFMATSALESGGEIVTATKLGSRQDGVDLDKSIGSALANRPDYASALKKLEREDIRVAYSKNQRWPQLDLKGSYGLNGLDYDNNDSLDDTLNADGTTWYMGLELRIPLGGGKKTRSELIAAQHKKTQALLELQALETAVKNAVHTSVGNVKSSSAQEKNYQQAAELNKRLLDVEMVRLNQGKSSNQDVLDREEKYHQAQNAHLDSIVENIKSRIELELIEGTLLQRFAAEVTEEI
jgi:outer membrane protein TolC